MVMTPASAHATSSQPGAPTNRLDSAETMKMPEPIIEPTTTMVASSIERPRWSSGVAASGTEHQQIQRLDDGLRARLCRGRGLERGLTGFELFVGEQGQG